MRGTDSCCELTDSERRILRLCRLHTVCLHAHVFEHVADQHIKLPQCVSVCVCVRNNVGQVGVTVITISAGNKSYDHNKKVGVK